MLGVPGADTAPEFLLFTTDCLLKLPDAVASAGALATPYVGDIAGDPGSVGDPWKGLGW